MKWIRSEFLPSYKVICILNLWRDQPKAPALREHGGRLHCLEGSALHSDEGVRKASEMWKRLEEMNQRFSLTARLFNHDASSWKAVRGRSSDM